VAPEISQVGEGLLIHQTAARVARARKVFNPHQPVADQKFFSGRVEQLDKTIAAIRTPGKHPIVFGVRGVGKTSLANIIKTIAEYDGLGVCSHQCNASSTFDSIIRKLLSGVELNIEKMAPGFQTRLTNETRKISDLLPTHFDQEDVVDVAEGVGAHILLIVDEFDRVSAKERRKMSDLIKAASDRSGSPLTIMLVGVAETLEELVNDHPSIERNIAEVHMRLMSAEEIRERIAKGAAELGLAFDNSVVEDIVLCAQGFPYYAHLLAQHSAIRAINNKQDEVSDEDFSVGLRESIENVDQTIKLAYWKATTSNKSTTTYPDVLYAASQAKCDEFGWFTAKELTAVPAKSSGEHFSLQGIQYPLSQLTIPERGEVIKKEGHPKRYKYRFANPMMRQYVIMRRMAGEAAP
jgi:hypothetical protein